MYESRSGNPHDIDATDPVENRATASGTVHLPAAGPAGDLTVLERLEAFRELIRHGNALLGEVVSYCRDAEAAVNQLAQEQQEIDRMRTQVEGARTRADAEAEAARNALAQVEAQRRELAAMRDELVKAHTEMERFQQSQQSGAEALEQSLKEAKQQQRHLEQELQRVRAQTASTRAIDARLGQLDNMEAKLRVTERELADTRLALEAERSRRDRAIALIKPKQVAGEVRTQ